MSGKILILGIAVKKRVTDLQDFAVPSLKIAHSADVGKVVLCRLGWSVLANL